MPRSSATAASDDNRVLLIAHRGKGPTSKFTDPTEELWQSELVKSNLEKNGVVKPSVMREAGKTLPLGVPPENTLAAFEKGISEGADGIELDIFVSKDGVPMVIHDDELNRNVAGARRKAKIAGDDGYLGKVGEYSAKDLKRFDMGGGNTIPTLAEVIDLVSRENIERRKTGKANIMLNIEFKDKKGDNVDSTVDVVREAIIKKIISNEDVVFCSFDHYALEKAAEISSGTLQVAPALKTAFLFGEDKVDVTHGWTVTPGTPYRSTAITELDAIISKVDSHGGKSVVAVDAVLWDIEEELVAFSERKGLALHASTSDFRSFENVVFIASLAQMRKRLPVYFKTDEPKKISYLFERAYAAEKLDLTRSIMLSAEPARILPHTSGLDLTSVRIASVSSLHLARRLPKPGQEVSEKYKESILEHIDDSLKKFIEEDVTLRRDFHERKEATRLNAARGRDSTSVKELLTTGPAPIESRVDAECIRASLSSMRRTASAAHHEIAGEERRKVFLDGVRARRENKEKGRGSGR